METWLESVNDLLVPHIFKGLQEAYNAVNRLTKGSKLLIAFQVTLEGITTLSQPKIAQDYTVLMNNLGRNGHPEDWFTTLLEHLYHSYAKSALEGAGLKLGDHFDASFIEVPDGSAFVHMVYINTARELWQKPFLFSHKVDSVTQQNNANEIMQIIRNSISRAVRDGVNLNRLLTAYKTGTPLKNERHHSKEESPESLREKFKRINQDIFQSENTLNDETYLTEPLDRLSVCETVDDENNEAIEYTISDVSEDEPLQDFKIDREDLDNLSILKPKSDTTSNYTIQTAGSNRTTRSNRTARSSKSSKIFTVDSKEESDEENHSVHTILPERPERSERPERIERLNIKVDTKKSDDRFTDRNSELVVHLLDDELQSRLSLLSTKSRPSAVFPVQ